MRRNACQFAACALLLAMAQSSLPAHTATGVTGVAAATAWKPTDAQALPGKPVTGNSSETIGLVPCGCSKFRIRMFPVTARAWGHDLR